MGDLHEMVVDDVGEIVGGHAIALQEHLVLQFLVGDGDVAMEHVEEGRLPVQGHFLADDIGIPVFHVTVDFFPAQVAASTVITAVSFAGFLFFRVAEAAVGMAFLHEFLGVFPIEIHALALDIGAVLPSDVRAFVRDDMCQFQGALDEVHCIRYVAGAIGVLNAKDEVPFFCFGKEIGIESRVKIPDVHISRRARGKACACFLVQNGSSS